MQMPHDVRREELLMMRNQLIITCSLRAIVRDVTLFVLLAEIGYWGDLPFINNMCTCCLCFCVCVCVCTCCVLVTVVIIIRFCVCVCVCLCVCYNLYRQYLLPR